METASATQQAPQGIEQIQAADVLVGVLADLSPEALKAICTDLRTLPGSLRIVVLRQNDPALEAVDVASATDGETSLWLIPWQQFGSAAPGSLLQSIPAAYQSVFGAAEKLGARACCVIASHLENPSPRWICRLVEPLLDGKFDFVAPCYAHHRSEGLLNASVISPLIRCLYGKRFLNPMGPDLGVSRRLFAKMFAAEGNGNMLSRQLHPLASLAPMAICNNLPAAQVHLGSRVYPAPDWGNVSSLMAQAMGPVFLDMERNVVCWQRTRGSTAVVSFGSATRVPEESGTVDIARMVNSFQLGVRDLQEIWHLVLPPTALVEIGKLARQPAEQFVLPDDLWVRIIYDFALAHRLRTINRDHLLRSLTPLYLGWVASFAREMQAGGASGTEQRLERLSLAFEANKPYLVSRWRWPDRFNP